MIKDYKFNYGGYDAEARIIVNTDRFKEESAKELLEFFWWKYDKEADPIDELMKKYAMKAIFIASADNLNLHGVRRWFEEQEGFIAVDGSQGVELVSVEKYEFDESELEMTVNSNY